MSLSAFVSVEKGEGRSATLMLLHSFSMGLATVFFETAASALFLERFTSASLPWVYLVAAGVNTFAGLLYSAAQTRMAFGRLMVTTLAVLLVATVGFRLGLAATGAGWLIFGMLVWYRVLSILTDLEYWAVAARLYDVRQAKRLFGFVGSGEVTARILGAFSVPLLVHAGGVRNLLLLSAIALACCLGLLVAVLRLVPEHPAAPPKSPLLAPAETGPRAALRKLMGNRYLLLIVTVAALGALGKYFVDFAFLEQMKSRFADASELATFFGVFSGVSQTLSLGTRVFLSGRVLSRLGVRVGLLVLPTAQVACTLALVACGFLPGLEAGVFWLVVLNQGIYKTLKHPIDNPAFKVLYQPLRREDRLAAQITVETIVTPLAIGFSGLVMLWFSAVLSYDPVEFAWALLAAFGLWMLAAVHVGREYAHALVGALRGRLDGATVTFDDEQSVAIMERILAQGRPREALSALDMIEHTSPERLAGLLPPLLGHHSADVRLEVLGRIERLRTPIATSALRRLTHDPAPEVRAASLRALCVIGGSAVIPEVARALEDPDPQVAMGAVIGLLRLGSPFANAQLSRRAGSRNPKKRIWAARVLAEAGAGTFHEPLLPLLADPVPEVRRMALQAAGRLANPALWPAVIEALAQPAFCGAAASALALGGESAARAAGAALVPGRPASALIRIARTLCRIGGPTAITTLKASMDFPDAAVRHEVLRALHSCGFQAEAQDAEAVRERLRAEAADARWLAQLRADIGTGDEDWRLLSGALQKEVDRAIDRIFLLLTFVYDPQAMVRARDHREDASKEKRAYALEVLDISLDAEDKELLMPLLDAAAMPPASEAVPEGDKVARLTQLLESYPERTSSWTQACVLAAVGRFAGPAALRVLESLPSTHRTPLLRQTLDATLMHLRTPVPTGKSAKRIPPMRTIEKVITLKSVDMFSRADEDVLADVAGILEEVEIDAGRQVFAKGDAGDSMYIIVEGRVRVFDGDRTIVTLGERDIFGELALLDPEPRFASVEAVTDSRLFRLDREAFLELMAGNIDIVRGVLHVLCDRLRRTVRDHGPYQDQPTLTPPGS